MHQKLAFYQNIQLQLEQEIAKLDTIISRVSWIRLILFVTAIACWFILQTLVKTLVFSMLVIGFALIIRYDNKCRNKRRVANTKIKICKAEQELNVSKNQLYYDGSSYSSSSHAYTSDLDVFGPYSIFHLVNRCFTPTGMDVLAGWLKSPSSKNEIIERQQAVKELSQKFDFRMALGVAGILNQEDGKIIDSESWSGDEKSFQSIKNTWIIASILMLLNLGLAIASFWLSDILALFTISIIGANFYIYGSRWSKVKHRYQIISKTEQILKLYKNLLKIIESEKLESSLNKELKNELQVDGHRALHVINKIEKIIQWIDLRLNPMYHIFINSLFFTDIWFLYRIEKWKIEHGQLLHKWKISIGNFEALISLSTLHFNNSDWCFPEINDAFSLAIESFTHPLISIEKRVSNSYKLNQPNHVDILTGSNMSGKSTFLRSIGVNIVLALAGAPVCAKSMSLYPIVLMTYMRMSDSLEDSTSAFYAEIKRMRQILEISHEQCNVFLLLDELLRGTNSMDGTKGSMAIIKKVISDDTSAIIATHDLSITKMKSDYPKNIDTFYFDIIVTDGRMVFDYKLKHGVCQSTNASLLLKEIGLEIE